MAHIQNRHALEARVFRNNQLDELKEEARKKGVLVQDPKEFNPKLVWETRYRGAGYKEAVGRDPEKEMDVLTEAYYCGHCGGWIQGQPNGQKYNNLGPLSGSKGTSYNCGICDLQIGANIEMMS